MECCCCDGMACKDLCGGCAASEAEKWPPQQSCGMMCTVGGLQCRLQGYDLQICSLLCHAEARLLRFDKNVLNTLSMQCLAACAVALHCRPCGRPATTHPMHINSRCCFTHYRGPVDVAAVGGTLHLPVVHQSALFEQSHESVACVFFAPSGVPG